LDPIVKNANAKGEFRATVVITSRDRQEELSRAIKSVLMQDVPLEVLVMDDASSDGTPDMVREQFPSVRLVRSEVNLGLIEQRNRAAALASCEIIITIDDDAEFASPETARQTIDEFVLPQVGVVAIPYIDVNYSPEVRQIAPGEGVWVAAEYRGTAHALRRSLFLRLGGYRGHLFRQGEEVDYSIRVIDAGYEIRLGRASPIMHFESPRRDKSLIYFYLARNNLLFAWHNVPSRMLIIHAIATSFNSLKAGTRLGYVGPVIRGLLAALRDIVTYWKHRRPVSIAAYRTHRKLRAAPARLPLSQHERGREEAVV
jgi:GT2 family glycosyltransferase